jgi:hypothetical protein
MPRTKAPTPPSGHPALGPPPRSAGLPVSPPPQLSAPDQGPIEGRPVHRPTGSTGSTGPTGSRRPGTPSRLPTSEAGRRVKRRLPDVVEHVYECVLVVEGADADGGEVVEPLAEPR